MTPISGNAVEGSCPLRDSACVFKLCLTAAVYLRPLIWDISTWKGYGSHPLVGVQVYGHVGNHSCLRNRINRQRQGCIVA